MEKSYWEFLDKKKHLNWNAISNKDRINTISELTTVINNYGFIIDFKFYSDLAVALSIEIEEQKIQELFSELSHFLTMDKDYNYRSKLSRERIILLNVTFAKSTGKQTNEIPSVPG